MDPSAERRGAAQIARVDDGVGGKGTRTNIAAKFTLPKVNTEALKKKIEEELKKPYSSVDRGSKQGLQETIDAWLASEFQPDRVYVLLTEDTEGNTFWLGRAWLLFFADDWSKDGARDTSTRLIQHLKQNGMSAGVSCYCKFFFGEKYKEAYRAVRYVDRHNSKKTFSTFLDVATTLGKMRII